MQKTLNLKLVLISNTASF